MPGKGEPMRAVRLRPVIKWTGGKSGELPLIRAAFPGRFARYLEPFAGGAAVLFSVPAEIPAEANDVSGDLIALYRLLASGDTALISAVRALSAAWETAGEGAGSVPDPECADAAASAAAPLAAVAGEAALAAVRRQALAALARKRRLIADLRAQGREVASPETLLRSAVKSAVYTAVREACDNAAPGPERAAMFWFVREFCYGGMFRSNAAGRCNVPYGGMSYDSRSMSDRLRQATSPETLARLRATRFHHGDFEAFLSETAPSPDDFVFLDPPYDSRFSSYDGRAFGRDDHRRLARAMSSLRSRWMMVISETDFVCDTYCGLPGVHVSRFGKKYLTGIKNRYDARATHLLLTNFAPEAWPFTTG